MKEFRTRGRTSIRGSTSSARTEIHKKCSPFGLPVTGNGLGKDLRRAYLEAKILTFPLILYDSSTLKRKAEVMILAQIYCNLCPINRKSISNICNPSPYLFFQESSIGVEIQPIRYKDIVHYPFHNKSSYEFEVRRNFCILIFLFYEMQWALRF